MYRGVPTFMRQRISSGLACVALVAGLAVVIPATAANAGCADYVNPHTPTWSYLDRYDQNINASATVKLCTSGKVFIGWQAMDGFFIEKTYGKTVSVTAGSYVTLRFSYQCLNPWVEFRSYVVDYPAGTRESNSPDLELQYNCQGG